MVNGVMDTRVWVDTRDCVPYLQVVVVIIIFPFNKHAHYVLTQQVCLCNKSCGTHTQAYFLCVLMFDR